MRGLRNFRFSDGCANGSVIRGRYRRGEALGDRRRSVKKVEGRMKNVEGWKRVGAGIPRALAHRRSFCESCSSIPSFN